MLTNNRKEGNIIMEPRQILNQKYLKLKESIRKIEEKNSKDFLDYSQEFMLLKMEVQKVISNILLSHYSNDLSPYFTIDRQEFYQILKNNKLDVSFLKRKILKLHCRALHDSMYQQQDYIESKQKFMQFLKNSFLVFAKDDRNEIPVYTQLERILSVYDKELYISEGSLQLWAEHHLDKDFYGILTKARLFAYCDFSSNIAEEYIDSYIDIIDNMQLIVNEILKEDNFVMQKKMLMFFTRVQTIPMISIK